MSDAPPRIPAVFWYACAYGVVVLTTILAGVAWRAGSASIEVEGVKIDLQQALSREKEREAADQAGGPTPAQRAAWHAAHTDQLARRGGPDPGTPAQGQAQPSQRPAPPALGWHP